MKDNRKSFFISSPKPQAPSPKPLIHPQPSRDGWRSCRLEPVNPFADQIELQSVTARGLGRRNVNLNLRLVSRWQIVGQPRARVVAIDQRTVGGDQLRAEAHQPPARGRVLPERP